MMKKTSYLLIILLILLVFLLSYRLLVFNEVFYKKEFLKYNIYDKFSKEEVDKNVNELVGYLNNKNTLETDFFNEKEKLHLKDVKSLIQTSFIIFDITLFLIIAILIYLIHKKYYVEILNSFFYASISTLILTIIIALFSLFNFNRFFTSFHLVLFSNNLWFLNSEIDNLIVLFPEVFFYDTFKAILITTFLLSLILLVATLIIKRKIKK